MDVKQLVLLFVHMESVLGYISGAPLKACVTMAPGHGADSQRSTSPYTITVSSETFRCKQDITVTLNGTETFKGFLCQVRTDINAFETVGKLSSIRGLRTTNECGRDVAAITHTDNADKSTAVFNWRSNTNVTTEVYVVCTIVKQYDTLWIKQNSTRIKYEEGGDCFPYGDENDKDPSSSGSSRPSVLALFLGHLVMWFLTICYQ